MLSILKRENLHYKTKTSFHSNKYYSTSFFDDIPSLESINTSASKDASDLLLDPARKLIELIVNYVKNEPTIQVVDINDVTPANVQCFIYESKKYLLVERHHLDYVYNLMINYNYEKMYDKTLEKTPKLFFNVLNLNNQSNASQPWEHIALKLLDPEQILKSTFTVLSYMFTHKMQRKSSSVAQGKFYVEDDYSIESETDFTDSVRHEWCLRLGTVMDNLGYTVIMSVIQRYIFYGCIKNDKINERQKDDKKKGFIEFKERSLKNLLKVFKALCDPIDYAFLEEMGLPLEFLENKELLNHVKNYLHYYLSTNHNNEIKIIPIEDSEQKYKEFTIYYHKIGLELINILESNNVLTVHRNGRNSPIIELNPGVEHLVNASAVYYKPQIATHTFNQDFTSRTESYNYLKPSLDNTMVRNSRGCILEVKQELKESLLDYNEIPFKINISAYDDFIRLWQDILALDNLESHHTLNFLKSIYFIDFGLLLQNNDEPQLVKSLIQFGLNINYPQDIELQKKLDKNLACKNAYYVIVSYKQLLVGLLNDVELYKHFNYFFISHYLKSSGRSWSMPHYLQFQSYKLARVFISLLDSQVLKENQLKLAMDIISEFIPEVKNQTDFWNFEEYNKKNQCNYKEYILSMCKKNTIIESYPYETFDPLSQISWLTNFVIKPENILLVKNLIHSLKEQKTNEQFLKKDATGSGPQLIAMVMGDEQLPFGLGSLLSGAATTATSTASSLSNTSPITNNPVFNFNVPTTVPSEVSKAISGNLIETFMPYLSPFLAGALFALKFFKK